MGVAAAEDDVGVGAVPLAADEDAGVGVGAADGDAGDNAVPVDADEEPGVGVGGADKDAGDAVPLDADEDAGVGVKAAEDDVVRPPRLDERKRIIMDQTERSHVPPSLCRTAPIPSEKAARASGATGAPSVEYVQMKASLSC